MSSGRGHEHLDEFALIHMNGRAYDYNLGRFYGVDPVIQFPGNSQSLNPYAYLMNNPLAGTDPTGYAKCGSVIKDREVCQVDVPGEERHYDLSRRTWVEATKSTTYTIANNGGAIFAAEGNGPKAFASIEAQMIGAPAQRGKPQVGVTPMKVGVASGYSELGFEPPDEDRKQFLYDPNEPTSLEKGLGNLIGSLWSDDKDISHNFFTGEPINRADRTVTRVQLLTMFMPGPKGLRAVGRAASAEGAEAEVAALRGFTKGCCCFAEGTEIYTADGMKAIEQLKIGDMVWARDEKTGLTALKPVTQMFVTAAKPIFALVTQLADGSQETIEVTDNHPYWVIGQGWVDSGKLLPGMQIENFAKGQLVVVSLTAMPHNEVTYNFTVGDFHTYFVGGQRALVHNCSNNCISPALLGDSYHPIVVSNRSSAWKSFFDSLTPNKINQRIASFLGYDSRIAPNKAPFNSHGQDVFSNGSTFITRDIDGHKGGFWKVFDRKFKRLGTYDETLTDRIGD
jgi:RHS repeat-associated protein